MSLKEQEAATAEKVITTTTTTGDGVETQEKVTGLGGNLKNKPGRLEAIQRGNNLSLSASQFDGKKTVTSSKSSSLKVPHVN